MTQEVGDKPVKVLISASILDKFIGTSICICTPTFFRVLQPLPDSHTGIIAVNL